MLFRTRIYPFESVVEIVRPERVAGANPLFQVAFVWQNDMNEPFKLEGIKSEVIKGDQRTAIFDISLALREIGDTIEGEIEYNMDIIKPETIKRLKSHFLILINNLIANPDSPVNSVPIISEDEIKIISEINNTATDYPKDKTLVELFEGIAAMFPDKTALVFKGESCTYRQLNEKSNQLARTLQGIRSEQEYSCGPFYRQVTGNDNRDAGNFKGWWLLCTFRS